MKTLLLLSIIVCIFLSSNTGCSTPLTEAQIAERRERQAKLEAEQQAAEAAFKKYLEKTPAVYVAKCSTPFTVTYIARDGVQQKEDYPEGGSFIREANPDQRLSLDLVIKERKGISYSWTKLSVQIFRYGKLDAEETVDNGDKEHSWKLPITSVSCSSLPK